MSRTRRTTAAAEVPETTSPTDTWVPAALSALHTVLGPAPDPAANPRTSAERTSDAAAPLEFHPADATGIPTWTSRHEVPAETAAVIVRTSGSTGTPKQTLLPAAAIHASVAATAQALGGHGQWLLTLQPSYVAGLAVLARSLGAGTTPVPLLHHATDPRTFTEAAQRLTADRRFVSLVPTQLQRLLDHVPQDQALKAALARFDAILLGGGASSGELLDLAAAHGLQVVRTYGMSETCGGCVYDGRPLPGVRLETVSTDGGSSGRVRITGPMVARGYLNDPDLTAAHFSQDPDSGERRFLTDDLGEVQTDAGGQLLGIAGRADDVINTGGVKVSAESVRSVLLDHPQVRDAFVGPVPDPEWGQKVCAAVVLTTATDPGRRGQTSGADPDQPGAAAEEPDAEGIERELQRLVRGSLGRAAAPKRLLILPELPALTSGKPDRQRLLQLLGAPVPPSGQS
ncbi:AMP-binding protein [Nesterenkonia sandarakina]|uniref:O-succinylbenzoic acid--CoA ligase n=1 Tax=Nesterenkonia sandarakina TaxID=272918 RepID=A0A2T0YFH1_9MICC|nr:AMP-binding protein [Nesterenkonia sandarakina]PRZ13679.1 O-succinylbenzoic acid--CoA ligase [Nesterenkonia sandarakina]